MNKKNNPLKILIFYQFFSTPKGSWGTRIYEFSKEWIKEGCEVTVVTSIFSKSDLKASKLIENQIHDGINVKVINIEMNNKHSFLKRIFAFIYYAILSCWYALTEKPDVVIASSGPITVGLPGLISKIMGRKLVFEVRDLWPEGPIELGIIKNKFLKIAVRAFEKLMYKKASLVVGLSPGMRDYVKNNFNHSNVISITNSCNLDLFDKSYPFNELQNLKELDSYAIYTGNIGAVNNSYLLINAARYLKEIGEEEIKIVLIGEGQQREELCEIARRENLDNFIYLGLMSKEKLIPYIKKSMVSIVPLQPSPVLDTSSPNKFFESLASGVPVIQTTNGWIKNYILKNKVGFTIDGNNAKELGDLLVKLHKDPLLVSNMGKKSLECAKRDFDQQKLSAIYLKALRNL